MPQPDSMIASVRFAALLAVIAARGGEGSVASFSGKLPIADTLNVFLQDVPVGSMVGSLKKSNGVIESVTSLSLEENDQSGIGPQCLSLEEVRCYDTAGVLCAARQQMHSAAGTSKWQLSIDTAGTWRMQVTTAGITTTFSSALGTLEAGYGDCGEHAVLLAALLRASGIPARVVAGLLYVEANKGYFYHAWVMAYTGEWVFADPSHDCFPASRDRIPLVIDDDGTQLITLAKVIGRTRVEYVTE